MRLKLWLNFGTQLSTKVPILVQRLSTKVTIQTYIKDKNKQKCYLNTKIDIKYINLCIVHIFIYDINTGHIFVSKIVIESVANRVQNIRRSDM